MPAEASAILAEACACTSTPGAPEDPSNVGALAGFPNAGARTPGRFGDRRRGTIGLLGGSFDPAHGGHLAIARQALHALGLDQVWLLVSPGNPLKDCATMSPVGVRLASARRLADGRRVVATDIERHLGTRFTVDTIEALRRRFPCARFVWLMGADSFRDFSRWRRWVAIARQVPIAVFPRPSYNRSALAGRAAHRFVHARRSLRDGSGLAWAAPPAWAYLIGRETSISATALRAAAGGTRTSGLAEGRRP